MEKNILIGNGINIQYGGIEEYSNSAIIKRMLRSINSGKYEKVIGLKAEEQIEILKKLYNVLVNIKGYKPYENYLFLKMEVERIYKQYNTNTPLECIGMEDYFLALEFGFKKDDPQSLIDDAKMGLKIPILDAIYNNGKINEIEYGTGFRNYLSRFNNVFTLNYDSNLDRYSNNVYHLHGLFSMLAPEYDTNSEFSKNNPKECKAKSINPDLLHVYSNSIMSWYWLEKYGQWIGKERIYGSDVFKSISGKLTIVGMSPCNDEHLFIMINQSKINNVVYYYFSDADRLKMQKKINKPITFIKVDKLWKEIQLYE